MLIWLDGRLVPREAATISVFDHGLLYGDGVFEGIRVYARRIFRLDAHLERLYDSARALALEIPMDRAAMAGVVEETVRANKKDDAYIRLVVTRGVGDLGVDPARCPKPTVICIVTDIQVYPPERYAAGIKVITSATRQVSHEAYDPRIKSLNYLKNVLAKIDATRAGCEEAIMLNDAGFIAECTADNIFAVRGGVLLTPSPQDGALAGERQDGAARDAGEAGVEAREARMGRFDVYTADEVFVTGTGAEVMPVTMVDGRPIGDGTPGPVTKRLKDAFHAFVRTQGTPLW
jgi:branched-chain amino acid aminotransferase